MLQFLHKGSRLSLIVWQQRASSSLLLHYLPPLPFLLPLLCFFTFLSELPSITVRAPDSLQWWKLCGCHACKELHCIQLFLELLEIRVNQKWVESGYFICSTLPSHSLPLKLPSVDRISWVFLTFGFWLDQPVGGTSSRSEDGKGKR